MSEQSSSQSKTEQPTHKKLRDLRRKGEIPISQDVSSVFSMLVMIAALTLIGHYLLQSMQKLIDQALSYDLKAQHLEAMGNIVSTFFLQAIYFSIPLVLLVIFAGLVIGFIQQRGLFVINRIVPDLNRLNPIAGLKRIFSLHTFIELIKLMLKSALLTLIVYLLMRQLIGILFNARFLPTQGVLTLSLQAVSQLVWMSLVAFILFAAADIYFQRWNFMRKNMMTKEEVRREYKEMEGDPHMRSKRKQLQQELSFQGMINNVRKANVVVVNPTHIAVALYYNPNETEIPVVLAKGEGFIAAEIRRVAEQEGIPILRDIQLARQLQAQVPVNHYIPEDLIEPVAAVLRWVRDIKKEG